MQQSSPLATWMSTMPLVPPCPGGLTDPDCRGGIPSSLSKLTSIAFRADLDGPAKSTPPSTIYGHDALFASGRMVVTRVASSKMEQISHLFCRVTTLQTEEKLWTFPGKIAGNMSKKCTFIHPNSLRTSRIKN